MTQVHRRLQPSSSGSRKVFQLKLAGALRPAVALCLYVALPAAHTCGALVEAVRAAAAQTANDTTTRPDELTAPVRGDVANALAWRDRQSGLVRRVEGHVSFPNAHTEVGVAREFLRRYGRLLTGSRLSTGFRLTRKVKTLTGTHFVFTRLLNGLRVFDDQITIHVDDDVAVTLVTSDLKMITTAKARPSRRDPTRVGSRDAALAAVRRAEPSSAPARVEAGYYVNDHGVPLLAWRVIVRSETSSAREFIVDGLKNIVVSVKDLVTVPK